LSVLARGAELAHPFIGGRRRAAEDGARFTVVDPATEAPIAKVADSSAASASSPSAKAPAIR
jgi:succinate-semialdehyde dehydrogenase/glutarate-semialdehyde dehydrogenase